MKKQPIKKAVALKYEPTKDQAPKVIAKGAGAVADKILEQAEKHDIKIREDKALSEMLYQLEIEEQIPPALYPIIAEVFAFIYQAEQRAGEIKRDTST